jgi:tRNA(Ile)-lysidine synthase
MPIGGRWRLELARGRVRAHRLPPAPRVWPALGDGAPGTADVGVWLVRWDVVPAEPSRREGLVQFVPPGGYHLRAWRAGDRVRPLGGTGSRSVGRCLQDAGIGKGQRAGWPVLVADEAPEEIVWVVGVCRAAVRLPEPGTRSVRVTAERR